jgi:D-amino-acid dehydrogenase
MKSALIIGGGIVGMNLALELQGRGHHVTVAEAAPDEMSASLGNAGHIATEQADPIASWATIRSTPGRLFPRGPVSLPGQSIREWLPFAVRMARASGVKSFQLGRSALTSLVTQAVPAWHRRLAALGASDLLREDGHYVVWESDSSAARGKESWRAANTGPARFRDVTGDELSELRALGRSSLVDGVRFENTGQIADLPRLLALMRTRFVENGGSLLHAQISALRTDAGVGRCEIVDHPDLTADAVVVCAGVRSRPLLTPLGLNVPMIAERGYHIQSASHGWPAAFPPVVFEDRSIIVTSFETGLRVAGFVEFSRAGAPPDSAKWRHLERHVRELGLPFGDLATAAKWMGSRPTLPDYLPALGRVSGTDNLYYAFGHNHLGLTLAAATSEIMAEVIHGGTAPDVFCLERFQ